jgi:membrane protein implicated in regulation of membrane protease activity
MARMSTQLLCVAAIAAGLELLLGVMPGHLVAFGLVASCVGLGLWRWLSRRRAPRRTRRGRHRRDTHLHDEVPAGLRARPAARFATDVRARHTRMPT